MSKVILFFYFYIILNIIDNKFLSIFYLNGKAYYKESKESKEWVSLSFNNKLSGSNVIKVPIKTELILINDSGNSIKLKPGIHNVSNLVTELSSNVDESNIFNAYLKFVWKKLLEEHDDLDKYANKYMHTKGLVSRGGCKTSIQKYPYHESKLTGNKNRFIWKSNSPDSLYIFEIYPNPNGGKALFSQTTKENTLEIDFNKIGLKKGREYFWTVHPTNSTICNFYKFQPVNNLPEEILYEIEKKQGNNKPISELLKGAYCEDNLFLIEAEKHYENAAKMAPDNKLIKDSYMLFLERNLIFK